jgi:hypothetical protein
VRVNSGTGSDAVLLGVATSVAATIGYDATCVPLRHVRNDRMPLRKVTPTQLERRVSMLGQRLFEPVIMRRCKLQGQAVMIAKPLQRRSLRSAGPGCPVPNKKTARSRSPGAGPFAASLRRKDLSRERLRDFFLVEPNGQVGLMIQRPFLSRLGCRRPWLSARAKRLTR